MAEASWPPVGPVSVTRAAPLGANATEKAPGPALAFITMGDNVPFFSTRKTSMLLVSRSVTRRNWPLGLKAKDAAPEVLVLRKLSELGMGRSLPSSVRRKPTTLLLPPVLRTYRS